jgi:putative Holliday junction resolvase
VTNEVKTYICFDYGTRRIGVAVGQSITQSASPLTTLVSQQNKPDWSGITALIEEWRPDLAVVGLPLNADGSEHDVTKAAKRFGNQLQAKYNLTVEWMDERLSSHAAEQMLRESNLKRKKTSKKEIIDQYAAKIILDAWFQQPPV